MFNTKRRHKKFVAMLSLYCFARSQDICRKKKHGQTNKPGLKKELLDNNLRTDGDTAAYGISISRFSCFEIE